MKSTDVVLLVEKFSNVLELIDEIGFDSEKVDTEGIYQNVQGIIYELEFSLNLV